MCLGEVQETKDQCLVVHWERYHRGWGRYVEEAEMEGPPDSEWGVGPSYWS